MDDRTRIEHCRECLRQYGVRGLFHDDIAWLLYMAERGINAQTDVATSRNEEKPQQVHKLGARHWPYW
jgi:hypothetical protein